MSVKLTLEMSELNQILEALGTRPYAEVFQLVEKIRTQASQALASDEPTSETLS